MPNLRQQSKDLSQSGGDLPLIITILLKQHNSVLMDSSSSCVNV